MNEIVITRCLYIDHYLIKIILTPRCSATKDQAGGKLGICSLYDGGGGEGLSGHWPGR